MDANDINRFVKLLYKEAGEKYFVQSPKSEPLSREIHIKVRKNGTLMLQKEEEISQTVHQGVDIDVFPVIGIPNNDRIKAFQLHLLQTFQNLRYKHSWNVDEGTWIKKAFKRLREHGIQLIESFVWLLAKQLGNRKKNTRCCIVGV